MTIRYTLCLCTVQLNTHCVCTSQQNMQLMRNHNVSRDLLPPKKLAGNLSKQLIDTRRQLLERYLQKMIHSEERISQSSELLEFLDVPAHVSFCLVICHVTKCSVCLMICHVTKCSVCLIICFLHCVHV